MAPALVGPLKYCSDQSRIFPEEVPEPPSKVVFKRKAAGCQVLQLVDPWNDVKCVGASCRTRLDMVRKHHMQERDEYVGSCSNKECWHLKSYTLLPGHWHCFRLFWGLLK